MTRLLTAVFAAALAGLVTLTGGLAVLMTSLGRDCTTSSAAAARTDDPSRTPASRASLRGWDSEQVGNALTVVAVGVQLGVPPREQIIALATAIQESGLRNLPYGDQDSLGLFQQRPSQGWGTPAQILDPSQAATRFYGALLAEPGWQALPLTVAAQSVQHSGHPDAYAAHETAATQLYAAITGAGAPAFATAGACVPTADELTPPSLPGPLALPPNVPPRVAVAISWTLAQLGTPYSYGGDCTAAHSGNPSHQCDCSSLVQQAYGHAGISLPRTAADQSRTGTPIPVDRIQPGDLIFESGADGTATNPGHVALALGNGYLVEAPHTGAVVRIASTFLRDVVAVRRIVADGPPAEPTQPLPALRRPG
jgi:cell wall-associated NlpC family hydrolase